MRITAKVSESNEIDCRFFGKKSVEEVSKKWYVSRGIALSDIRKICHWSGEK